MSPDERFLEKQAEAEEQKLQQKIQILSDADRKDIYEKGTLARPGRTRIISLILLQRLNHVVVSGLQLLAAQSTTQDASCLPALKVSDIEPIIPYTSVQLESAGKIHMHACNKHSQSWNYRCKSHLLYLLNLLSVSVSGGGVPVQYCEQPTNGMVYFRAMCNLNSLPEDLKIYVPLFCSVITKYETLCAASSLIHTVI